MFSFERMKGNICMFLRVPQFVLKIHNAKQICTRIPTKDINIGDWFGLAD